MASLAIRPWEDDMLHITVGRGDEDYATIQEAIDAVPYDMPAQITISEGVYREKLFSDKESISLCGHSSAAGMSFYAISRLSMIQGMGAWSARA